MKAGEPLLEVETEKSVVEIEAAVGGRLTEILVPVDQEAQVGDRIAWVETGVASAAPPASAAPRTRPPRSGRRRARDGRNGPAHGARGRARGERLRSSPVARRLAAEHGLDLRQLTGSGPRGRMQLADVQQRIAAGAAGTAGAAAQAPAAPGLPPMRRALARAMTLSNATVPQFQVERAVDCGRLQALRAAVQCRRAPPTRPGCRSMISCCRRSRARSSSIRR